MAKPRSSNGKCFNRSTASSGVSLADFEDAAVGDPALGAVRQRVRLTGDAGYAKDRAEVVVHLRDGRMLRADVPHARGTAERPLDDAGLDAKFLALAAPVLGRAAPRLLARAWSFEQCADAGALVRASRPPRA